MPEAIERIIADVNASMEMDEAITAAFTAGLSAGVMLGKCAKEKDEEAKED